MRSPFGALTKKAITDVWRRPVRSVLVILGIMIGVAGLTAINVANSAIYSALSYTSNESQVPNIYISARSVDPSLLAQVAATPNVKTAQLATRYNTRWQVPQGHVNLNITAYADLTHVTLNPFQITKGRLPAAGEIVMESSDNTLQHVAIGDSVTVDTPHGPTALRVVGLSRTLGQLSASFEGFATGYMSAAGIAQLADLTLPNLVEAQVNDTSHLDQTTGTLYNMLKADHVVLRGYSTDSNPYGPGPIDGLLTIMRVLAVVALLLTAFLIINTVTTLVAEQTKIIGTMKAVGGTRGKIVRSYLTSVVFYGIVGTALGFAVGIFGGYQLALFIAGVIILDLGPFSISPLALVVGAAIGIGIPVLAALVPLWNGTRITVREAISAYGISAGNGRGALSAMGAHLQWISQTTWLGLRSVFRKRGRAALTLLALTLSGAVFLAIQTTSYSVDRTLARFDTLYNWDISLNLNAPQPLAQIRSELSQVANVSAVEEVTNDGIQTRWGIIGVVGYEPNTQVYRYQLVKGRWLNGDEPSSMVVSNFVANKTHLTIGDTLTLTTATNSKTWTIVGIVDDPDAGTGFVGDTFVPTHILEDFNGRPRDEVNNFYVRAQDRSPTAVNALATRLDNQLSAQGLAPSVTTIAQFNQRSQSQFQILYILFYAVAFIVGLVGVLGLANTLTTSVLERRREIGILRSMGATGWRVSRVFWVEGLALAFIAWLIACVIGIPGAMAFLALIGNVLLPINFAFNPAALVAMLVVILVIATLASFGPTFSAARARVADILRYE